MILKGPQSVPRKYSPLHYTTWNCVLLLTPNSHSTIQMSQQKLRFIRSGKHFLLFCEPVWLGAPVVGFCHCSPFTSWMRDALLPTLVVTAGYFSYCCPPINSKESGYSHLTSIRHFLTENCHSLDLFSTQIHLNHLSSTSRCWFELQQIALPKSACLNALTWLDICVNRL